MPDVLILGGGVIGLSLAYDLSNRGRKVTVLEQNAEVGRESSWAGAGILPDAVVRSTDSPLEQLAGHALVLHRQWAARLKQETGIDNGYRVCGGVHLAEDAATETALEAEIGDWRAQGLRIDTLDTANVAEIEPSLTDAVRSGRVRSAYYLPNEAQVRNPRHVQALFTACVQRGVELVCDAAVQDFRVQSGKVTEVVTSRGSFSAGQIVLCGGAWTGRLAERLGLNVAVRPIRGQIALLHPAQPIVRRTIMSGRRYFVPRDDGRILVGSTEEDVGFDKSNTAAAIADLLHFAVTLVPQLRDAPLERTWAGLRPYSADGLPYLGEVPGLSNAFVAAGHYRWGLTLSTATAVCLAQRLCGEQPLVDLRAFRLDR